MEPFERARLVLAYLCRKESTFHGIFYSKENYKRGKSDRESCFARIVKQSRSGLTLNTEEHYFVILLVVLLVLCYGQIFRCEGLLPQSL